jgi:hypothetical protein
MWFLFIGIALYQWAVVKDPQAAVLFFLAALVCGQGAISSHIATIEEHLGIEHGKDPHR